MNVGNYTEFEKLLRAAKNNADFENIIAELEKSADEKDHESARLLRIKYREQKFEQS